MYNSLDSRLFGIWVDEGEKTGTTGIIYIFFKDGTFFESFRFLYGQGQIYVGTYRTEGNILFLTNEGIEEEKFFFEIDEIEGILRVKHETWETREFYLSMGFAPLEIFPLFWNEENPCLFMAKYLGNNEVSMNR